MTNDLLDLLGQFYQKGRLSVLKPTPKGGFEVNATFLQHLCGQKCLDIPIPAGPVFFALGYQLSWVYASFFRFFNPEAVENHWYENPGNAVALNQEALDLLIAFADPQNDDTLLFVMAEVMGNPPGKEEPLKAKMRRLDLIYETFDGMDVLKKIKPYFAFWSAQVPDAKWINPGMAFLKHSLVNGKPLHIPMPLPAHEHGGSARVEIDEREGQMWRYMSKPGTGSARSPEAVKVSESFSIPAAASPMKGPKGLEALKAIPLIPVTVENAQVPEASPTAPAPALSEAAPAPEESRPIPALPLSSGYEEVPPTPPPADIRKTCPECAAEKRGNPARFEPSQSWIQIFFHIKGIKPNGHGWGDLVGAEKRAREIKETFDRGE